MSGKIRSKLGRDRALGEKHCYEYTESIEASPAPWNVTTRIKFSAILGRLKKDVRKLEEGWAKWDDYVDSLDGKNGYADELELCDEWKEKEEYVDLMDDLDKFILEIETALEVPCTPTTVTNSSIATATEEAEEKNLTPIKLSSLNIPKFDGEYAEWTAFWENFDVFIHQQNYPDIAKFAALRSLLHGRALAEIQGISTSAANYPTVIRILKKRFGNEQFIIRELELKLDSIQPAKQNPTSIGSTVTAVTNMCRQLQNLGVDVNNNIMKNNVIKKMPFREQKELQLLLFKEPATSIDDILERMKDMEIEAEIVAKIPYSSNYQTPSSSAPQRNPLFDRSNADWRNQKESASASQTPRSPLKPWVCSFCEGNHISARCDKYKSIAEKLQQLQKKGACSKCAGRNHSTANCRSQAVCNNCGENHQTFLCRKPSTETKAFIALERKERPMLAKEITLKNAETNKEAQAVVFLDSGSQRNYVSNDLLNKLKLNPIATEVLNIEGIGGKKSSYKSKLVEIRIPTVDGSHLDISANSIPSIATTIPMVEVCNRNPLQYEIVKKQPDLLVGMEDFFSIVTSAKKQDGIVYVDSKIGRLISGKLDCGQQTLSCAALSSAAAGEGLVQLENLQLDKWWESHKKKHGKAHLSKHQFEVGLKTIYPSAEGAESVKVSEENNCPFVVREPQNL